jgi:hypothetical protein
MKIGKSSFFGVLALICFQTCGWSQSFRIDSSIADQERAYFSRWDSAQNRLILYRDLKSGGAPAVKIFKSDGSSTSFYPLADLAGAWSISVWGVAATPDGGIAAFVIPVYSAPGVKPPKLKRLLLVYDGNGKLTRAWDTGPYVYSRVAADSAGNIFAFGGSDLDEPYPLIVKYSPNGTIEKQFLSSADVPGGEIATLPQSLNGQPDMFVKGGQLFVWLAHSEDLFRFSLAGDLISKTSLAGALNGLADSMNSDHLSVECLTTVEDGEIFAQVHLWPKPPDLNIRALTISIPPDGTIATVLASQPTLTDFLGRTDLGKMVFFERQPDLKGGTLSER